MTIKMDRAAPAVSVQIATRAGGVPRSARFRHWALAALGQRAEITVRVVTAPEARSLNHRYRGKDYATNVLSFSYEAGRMRRGDIVRGDIVLCATVVSREAREQRKSPGAHYAHLTVHGILHLRGYDHETPAAARTMERHERRILRGLGYPDPYLPTRASERA